MSGTEIKFWSELVVGHTYDIRRGVGSRRATFMGDLTDTTGSFLIEGSSVPEPFTRGDWTIFTVGDDV